MKFDAMINPSMTPTWSTSCFFNFSLLKILMPSLVIFSFFIQQSMALELVKDGKPVALIVTSIPRENIFPAVAGKGKNPRQNVVLKSDEALAVHTLVDWVKKITDAELQITDKPKDGVPAIYIGQAAIKAGL
ncbi:MAG: hypothetical protein RL179_1219, partial [Planctomycetota bacterium]